MPRRLGKRPGRLAVLLLAGSLACAGCGIGPTSGSGSRVVAQGGGLPALHRLDWGIPDVLYAVWSPDGRWIAAMGGPDAGTVHLEVVSPDGGKRIDLSGWHCGSADGLWGIAWLPDNRLSCFAADAPLYRMCIGAEPFASCLPVALPTALRTSPQEGAVWSPDGRYLLLPAPIRQGYRTDLFVLSRAGRITQILPFAAQGGFGNPQWSADGTRLFYNRFFEVVDRAASLSADGNLTLGPARLLVSDCASEDAGDHVAWSPSRRWLAANCIVDSQFREESVFLISTAHQAPATAIVRVQQDGHGMLFPMWSPDGQTLIVFGWADGRPYAVDIGAYLRGKGLSP